MPLISELLRRCFLALGPGSERETVFSASQAVATLLGFLSVRKGQRVAYLHQGAGKVTPPPGHGNRPKPVSLSYLIYTRGPKRPPFGKCGFDPHGSFCHELSRRVPGEGSWVTICKLWFELDACQGLGEAEASCNQGYGLWSETSFQVWTPPCAWVSLGRLFSFSGPHVLYP